jgi:hypothetical protein
MEIQYEILNLNEGNGKIKNTNEIQQKNLEIQKLKEEQEGILKKKGKNIIEINISKIEMELDSFFQTNEKIIIKNGVFDLEIEKESFIVVEVKNYKKYKEIIKNVGFKRQLLFKLGVPLIRVYFIGILYEVDKNDLENNKSNLQENKIIIIALKDLLKNTEKMYENNTQSNVNTLEQKINHIEKRVDNIDSTVKMILDILKNSKNQKIINEGKLIIIIYLFFLCFLLLFYIYWIKTSN